MMDFHLGSFGRHGRLTAMALMALAFGSFGNQALAGGSAWSGATAISPINQPDPTRGSQLNDVAVNANGLTIAAWDQYTYNNGGGATIGATIQSGGRWSAPFTISGNTDNTGAPIGFAMTPRVAVGADGTMAVSWTYQANSSSQQQIQVSVKPAAATGWSTPYTLDTFTPGGVSINRSVPVAVDANGNVTAAWNVWDGTRNVVKAASLPKNGTTWTPTSTLSNLTDDGLYLSLAVNANGDAAVVYTQSPYSSNSGTWAEYVFRSGLSGLTSAWSAPVRISETIPNTVGYVTNPQVALDGSGLATVIYMGYGVEGTRQLSPGSWTSPQSVIQTSVPGASYLSPDLAVDANGNAVVVVSIFDPTINVDRASVWVAQYTANKNMWSSQQRLTDPSVPVDAYATRAAISSDGTLAMVGWIDHYHGVAQVAKLVSGSWNTTTIGKGTAWAAFQEVMGLDIGSGTVARAIWKNAKTGTQIMATSYGN